MTYEEDAAKLSELARKLPAIDVDASSADRIARVVRADVGHGPSLLRFVEPVVLAVFTASYLGWAIAKVLEALR